VRRTLLLELPAEARSHVHRSLGEALLADRPLSSADELTALVHLMEGGDPNAPVRIAQAAQHLANSATTTDEAALATPAVERALALFRAAGKPEHELVALLGVLTTNALVAANYVLVPTPINGLSVGTLRQLNEAITAIQSGPNDLLQVLGILQTMKDARTKPNKKLVAEIEEVFGKEALFKTAITTNTKVEEAPAEFQSIFSLDSGCVGATLYRDFVKKELMTRLAKLEKRRAELIEARY